jgi:exoribonuclease-2
MAINCYRKTGLMAKLVAHFPPKDTKIMGLCAEFDARYTSYNTHQQLVERYWCLRWLAQKGLPSRILGRTLKEGMVRYQAYSTTYCCT